MQLDRLDFGPERLLSGCPRCQDQQESKSAPDISVVVPVYHAEHCLRELWRRLSSSLETGNITFELVLVDDCSPDASWEVIKALCEEDERIKGVRFSRNFGQHYGITAGIDQSTGRFVVVMDCDLQDRPEEIPRLYEMVQKGHDIVLARRTSRRDKFLKRVTSKAFYGLFNYLTDLEYDGSVGNFRIMSRPVVNNFRKMRENLRFFGAQVQWLGYRKEYVDVDHSERFSGESTYTFKKLAVLATETIIAFSDKPLRLAVRLGFFMAASSFILGGYVVLNALIIGTPVLGWSSLMASLYFLGGLNITLLGIVGTYVGKTFSETKKRPLYVIRDVAGGAVESPH
jgi:dolichol-phosphate mannosyltransferase